MYVGSAGGVKHSVIGGAGMNSSSLVVGPDQSISEEIFAVVSGSWILFVSAVIMGWTL